MTEKRDVLFLAHRIPYPPDKGDKIRSWRLLEYLCRQYSVHLACFVDDPDDHQHEQFLRERCASAVFVPLNKTRATLRSSLSFLTGAPLSMGYYSDRRMKTAVAAARQNNLVAEVIYCSAVAPYVATPKGDAVRVIDFVDADSAKWSAYAADARFPMRWVYQREGRTLGASEAKIANWADASFAISPEEASVFNRRSDVKREVAWWANGVDTEYFDPAAVFPSVDQSPDVVFTGAMDYRANVDAVMYFVQSVWPRILENDPAAQFGIVGARPSPEVMALERHKGVFVTGRVDDIRPYIAAASIVVAPMRIARGVQNKVLEGMAMAKPVVSTPAGLEGISCAPGQEVIVADDNDAFAEAIIRMLDDPEERALVGARARARVKADYGWDAQLSRFSEALSQAVAP